MEGFIPYIIYILLVGVIVLPLSSNQLDRYYYYHHHHHHHYYDYH